MLVQLNSRTAKNLIMNNLFKLKHLESKYKNVVIAHDMTKNERKDCKTLVEEAKKNKRRNFRETTYYYYY